MAVFVLCYYWQSEMQVCGVYSTAEQADAHRNAFFEPSHYTVTQCVIDRAPLLG